MKYSVLCILLCVFCSPQLYGQANDIPYTVNLTELTGFPANTVYDIQDDDFGYMWFATDNGLFRYDGYEFQQLFHVPGDNKTLPSNIASCLLKDSQGRLWVGAGNHLSLWNYVGGYFNSYSIDDKLNSNFGIIEIVESPDKQIWVCNEFNQISCFNPSNNIFTPISQIVIQERLETTHPRIKSIYFESNEIAWLGTFQGLFKYNLKNKKAEHFNTTNDVQNPIGIINDIEPDPNDNNILWIGTWGQGLIEFHTNTLSATAYKFESGLPANLSNIIFDIQKKDENTLWITSRGLGQFNLKTRNFILPSNLEDSPRKISNPEIRKLHLASNNMLWLGTADGTSILDPSQQIFKYSLFDPHFSSVYILKDREKNQYYSLNIYSNRRLTIYDKDFHSIGSWPIPLADKYNSEPVSIFQDSHNQVWIGTIRTGTWKFNPENKQFQKVKFNTTIKGNQDDFFSEDFIQTDSNTIWIALRNLGPAKYQISTSKLEALSSHINFGGCQKLEQSDSNTMWGLSISNGLFQFSIDATNTEQFYELPDITDFTITPHKKLIACTRNNGIIVYDISSGRLMPLYNLNTTNGFPSNSLTQIILDKYNYCWIKYKNNLIHFNSENRTWKVYGAKDGLTGNLSYSELSVSNSGELFLTYGHGTYHFSPEDMKEDTRIPPLRLKTLNVMGQPINIIDSVSLNFKHNQNFISFDFIALEYSKQHELTYAYQLLGLDQGWVISGTRHFAEYPDLKPGNYTFLIKVQNGAGIWSDPIRLISFSIEPAWWQTWLFKISSFMIFVIILSFSIRKYLTNRFQQKLKQLETQRSLDQIRNRIARDIHDEIGSGLTKISLLTSRLETTETTERIRSSSKEIIGNLGDIIWAINPSNDSVQNFIAHLRDYTGRYFEETECLVNLKIQISREGVLKIILNPEIKRNAMMIIKEAYNNVLKHSGANKCNVVVSISDQALIAIIKDNGRGWNESTLKSGNGLLNMSKRAKDLKGAISFANTNTGVTITLEIPIS